MKERCYRCHTLYDEGFPFIGASLPSPISYDEMECNRIGIFKNGKFPPTIIPLCPDCRIQLMLWLEIFNDEEEGEKQ